MLKVTRTSDGLADLHIWREGDEYFSQKSPKFLKEWTNIMFAAVPQTPIENVHYVDLSKQPLDFPDNTFDAANSYHVLEHLTPQEGEKSVAEVFRVLKPGAVFRLSVPDLESICREYLHQLDAASREPTVQNLQRYQWNVLAVLDQLVREKSGGMMMDVIRAGDYDEAYLDEQYSDAYRPFYKGRQPQNSGPTNSEKRTFWQRVKTLTPLTFYEGLRWRIDGYVQRYFESKQAALQDPRITKEVWRWAYDRLSLSLLMKKVGFVEVQPKDFKHSDIPHWDKYDFDRSNFADRPIDPSVYVEGRKP
jgi:predicted SAM-dependent methyltransferase